MNEGQFKLLYSELRQLNHSMLRLLADLEVSHPASITAERLEKISGIGKVKAAEIMRELEENGQDV